MGVDRHELEKLIVDLGAMPPALHKEIRPALLRAGKPVLGEMRASAAWSTRIPGALSMQTPASGPGVTFRVSAARAPHARPYEHDGSPGEFRHPVYGHGARETWTWRPQAARLFFYGAVERNADAVTKSIGDALMDVAGRHGF